MRYLNGVICIKHMKSLLVKTDNSIFCLFVKIHVCYVFIVLVSCIFLT